MGQKLADDTFKELLNYNTGSWRDQAACSGMDPEVFFNASGTNRSDVLRLRKALKACGKCPVTSECLEFAKANDIKEGIYGGSRWVKNKKRWVNLLEESD